MIFPFGETVTVVRRTVTRDPMGDETVTETRADVPGCAVAPRTVTEETDRGRRDVITGKWVSLPYGTALDTDDRLEIGGIEYEVDGELGDWVSPFTGWEAGLEVNVKRVASGP